MPASNYFQRLPNRTVILCAIAVLFHAVGFWGTAVQPTAWVSAATPFHLLLMCALVLVANSAQWPRFVAWAAPVMLVTYFAEWIGVHYGWLFGGYQYGDVLGPKLSGVPPLIAVNWAVVSFGAISLAESVTDTRRVWMAPLAALLATAFDWLLEPVAMRLGYWQWAGGVVPLYNYATWAGLTLLVALLWRALRLRGNFFGIFLFVLQAVFFLLLRIFLR